MRTLKHLETHLVLRAMCLSRTVSFGTSQDVSWSMALTFPCECSGSALFSCYHFISQLATPLLWQVYIHCFLERLMATLSKSRHHRSSNIQLSWSGAVRLLIPGGCRWSLEQWKKYLVLIVQYTYTLISIYLQYIYLCRIVYSLCRTSIPLFIYTVYIVSIYIMMCLPVSICAHVCVKVFVHIRCKSVWMQVWMNVWLQFNPTQRNNIIPVKDPIIRFVKLLHPIHN